MLALPAGLGSLLQALAIPASFAGGTGSWAADVNADPQVILGDLGRLIVVALLAGALTGASSLATLVAAHRLWSGHPTGLRDSLAGALRAAPRAIALWALVLLALAVVSIAFAVVGMALIGAAHEAGLLAVVILIVVAVIGFAIVAVRLSLVLAVLVLERAGVIESVTRTWQLTRGHAIMLFATAFVVGLSAALGVYGGTLISSGTDSRLVAGVATGIATVIASPVSTIWLVLAWGDLVGDRHRDSPVMARGVGRWAAAALVFGFGFLLLVAGLVAAAGRLSNPTLGP